MILSNSTNKIDQKSGAVTPKSTGTGISFDSFTSNFSKASDQFTGYISNTVSGGAKLFQSGLDTTSSFFGDLSGSFFGDDDAKKTEAVNAVKGTTPADSLPKTLQPDQIARLTLESRQQTANQYLEQNKFAVRLISMANGEKVVFKSSPVTLSESRIAVYRPMDVMHLPGNYQIYSHTNPRTWQVVIKLFSRNGIEAEENLATITTIKSWLMPYFGKSNTTGVGDRQNSSAYSAELLGAPPDVLKFTAYSDQNSVGLTNVRNVSVVMTSVDIPYPDDVDYIRCSKSQVPFPTIMQITFQLIEVHSPLEYQKFNITDYKNGTLVSW